jgi:hypothetical protein
LKEGCRTIAPRDVVYYGDVLVGTISERTGNPHDTEPWEWHCGFYPGSRPGECTSGTAETSDQARADFEAAWKVLLANRSAADFQAWCDQEACGRLLRRDGYGAG